MSKSKYFSGTRWIDLTHDNAPVPYAETVSWEGCPHGFGHYTELSVCVRNNDTQHHIIAVVAKRYLEPFRFDAKGLMRQLCNLEASTLDEAKREAEEKIGEIIDAALEWAKVPKYMVTRCSLHEGGEMTSVGTFADYYEAELAMAKDRKEAANGWDEVDPDDVEMDDNSVSFGDEKFVWDILPIA